MSLIQRLLDPESEASSLSDRKSTNKVMYPKKTFRDFRNSGVEFEKIKVQKVDFSGDFKRNLFALSVVVSESGLEEPVPVPNSTIQIGNNNEEEPQERREVRIISEVKSESMYESLIADEGIWSPTIFEEEAYYEARESELHQQFQQSTIYQEPEQVQQRERLISLKSNSKVKLQAPSPLTANPMLTLDKTSRIYTRKYKKKKMSRLDKKLNIRQRISNFFGQGVNSLVLGLSPRTIKVLVPNIIIDIGFRTYLVYLCLTLFFATHKFIFFGPLFAFLLSRIIYFLAILKLSFDERGQLSLAYQKASVQNAFLQFTDILFMRRYDFRNVVRTVLNCFVPPQLSYWYLKEANVRLKIYFMLNCIYKGIESVLVLGVFSLVLLLESDGEKGIRMTAVSLILEETVRYVLMYLIINTFSSR